MNSVLKLRFGFVTEISAISRRTVSTGAVRGLKNYQNEFNSVETRCKICLRNEYVLFAFNEGNMT